MSLQFHQPWLLAIVFLTAIADWIGVGRNIRWLRFLAKPLVIINLGAWLWLQPIQFDHLAWFLAALFFSLLGDIWLLAPPRYLIAGLGSFLLAQGCYVIGFNHPLPAFTIENILLASSILILGIFLYPHFHHGVRKQPGAGRLIGFSLVYYIALSLMVYSAMTSLFRTDWPRQAVILVVAGSLNFFISDCLLAYDRFIRPVWQGRLMVHITYHLGQFGIIVGIALKYLH